MLIDLVFTLSYTALNLSKCDALSLSKCQKIWGAGVSFFPYLYIEVRGGEKVDDESFILLGL
jgi:hypothetical protein